MRRNSTQCHDCGYLIATYPQTGPSERYMVHDEVWADAAIDKNGGELCVPCLETRIGRPLTPEDFPTDIPINWPNPHKAFGWRTDRLARRLARTPEEVVAYLGKPSDPLTETMWRERQAAHDLKYPRG